MNLPGYDAWLTREPREPSPNDGDIAEDGGLVTTAAPCSVCGKPCALVEHVYTVWTSDYDEDTGKGGMRQVEACDEDEATTVSNPESDRSVWVCTVCAGWCDEGDIVRPDNAEARADARAEEVER